MSEINLTVVTAGERAERTVAVGTRAWELFADDPAVIAAELATVPIGRAIEATEVAATIAFLLGQGGAPYVGQVLAPNGGTVFSG